MPKYLILFGLKGETVGQFMESPSDRSAVVAGTGPPAGRRARMLLLHVRAVRRSGHRQPSGLGLGGHDWSGGDRHRRLLPLRDPRAYLDRRDDRHESLSRVVDKVS